MLDPLSLILAALLAIQTAGSAPPQQSIGPTAGGATTSAAMTDPGNTNDARAQIIDTGAP